MDEDKKLEDEAVGAGATAEAAAPANPLGHLEGEARAADAELFPKTDSIPPPPGVAEDEAAEPEAEPFASPDAPWVGAEKRWLSGEPEAPAAAGPAPDGGEAQAVAAPAASAAEEDEDALLVSPPQVPVLQSLIPPRPGVSTRLKVGIAAALVAVVGAAGGLVFWMGQSYEQELAKSRAESEREVTRLERLIASLRAAGGAENAARADRLEVELKAAREEASGDAPPALSAAADLRPEERRDRAPAGAAEAGEPPAATAAAPGEPPATAPGASAEDPEGADLLDHAIDGKAAPLPDEVAAAPAEPTAAPAAAAAATNDLPGADEPALPPRPSKEQVKAAMDAIAPQVARCGGEGEIVVSFTVAGATGRVTGAEPVGAAAGTPAGLCAARAVKLAKLPPFSKPEVQIKYPFRP